MQNDRYIEGLPAGYCLDCYRIECVLGQGGFGITYRARDLRGGRLVAIKEYFPAFSAARTKDARVCPRSQGAREEFSYGLHRFIKEAETLAHFSHPNIVKVWQLIDTNDTAYIVMSFEEGEPLGKTIERNPGGLAERDLIRLFGSIVDGLELVHSTGHLHRDLAPDNIVIRNDRTPVIIDFGSARYSYGQKSRSIEALIKCGYSPPEQYSFERTHQGPWTDVYALGAVAYRCIGGPELPGSLDRQHAFAEQRPDPLPPAAIIGKGRYKPILLNAIDKALAIRWRDRPPSAIGWYSLFSDAARQPTNKVAKAEAPDKPTSRLLPGFLRRLFFREHDREKPRGSGKAIGSRCWLLAGTDSTGAPVRTTISEQTLRQARGGLVIGRDKALSDITIPDSTVSRRHAVLCLNEQGLHIRDLGSLNGILINGVPVTPPQKMVPLNDRMRITLGCVELVVSVSRDIAAGA